MEGEGFGESFGFKEVAMGWWCIVQAIVWFMRARVPACVRVCGGLFFRWYHGAELCDWVIQ